MVSGAGKQGAMLNTYLAYGQWANRILIDRLADLPETLLDAPQPVVFGSIRRTYHHLLVIAQVWQAHLLGRAHGYTSRDPGNPPPMAQIAAELAALDAWFLDYGAALDAEAQSQVVPFTFIGGGPGAMTRVAILMHVVNHATYHRGHLVAMLNAAGISMANSDMPVFLTAPAELAGPSAMR